MSNISSHSLFHFTHSLENLEMILKDGLLYSIIGEKIPGTKLMYIASSISLCNIPLSLISEHTEWYGVYAIGIKPTFIKRLGGTPMIYAHDSSPFLTKLKGDARKNYYKQNPLTPYLKQTMGYQRKYMHVNKTSKSYYDEREWRLVNSKYTVQVERFDNSVVFEQIVNHYKEEKIYDPVPIPLSEIEYIIIRSQSELDTLVGWFAKEDLPSLLHKVLIYNKIKREI